MAKRLQMMGVSNPPPSSEDLWLARSQVYLLPLYAGDSHVQSLSMGYPFLSLYPGDLCTLSGMK